MFPEKERTPEESQELIRALAWNDAFGCYTRAGFEKLVWPEIAQRAKWIIYFDVDGMHDLNEAHSGYEFADVLIKQVFGILRLTDYVAGQFKSGDEFLICLVDGDQQLPLSNQRESLDPQGMMERLIIELKKQGMTATFAIVPVISRDLATNVKPAVDQVYAAKKARGAGR
jgi:GGDEF domain-containing protein